MKRTPHSPDRIIARLRKDAARQRVEAAVRPLVRRSLVAARV